MRYVRLAVQFVGEMAESGRLAFFSAKPLERVLCGLHDVLRRPSQALRDSGLVRVVQLFVQFFVCHVVLQSAPNNGVQNYLASLGV